MNDFQKRTLHLIQRIEKVCPRLHDGSIDFINWKIENKKQVSTYHKLKRDYNSEWKKALKELLSTDVQKTKSYEYFLDHLKDNNIEHTLPIGFKGDIDIDGHWWFRGKKINGKPSGYVFPTVKMNSEYSKDSPWIFVAVKEDGTTGNYYYTEDFKKSSRKEKFSNVRELISTIDKIRSKWIKLIYNFNESKPDTVAAVILELLYSFSARIGSEGNGTSHRQVCKTYGISTLRVKHMRSDSQATNMVFRYMGKDAVKTVHKLLVNSEFDLKLFQCINKLTWDKKPSDHLFTYTCANGKKKPIRSNVINGLFKKLGAGDCTVHKLRTYHATKIAIELIDELKTKRKKFKTTKLALEALLKIALKIGKKLNHVRRTKEGKQVVNGMTALANYIDVSLQQEFFDYYGVEYPKYLTKLI